LSADPFQDDVTLAVLAGGAGARLGGVQKALLRLDGRCLLDRLLDLSGLFGQTLVVSGDPACQRPGIRTVADEIPGKGAPGGIHAALHASRTPWVLAIACDMPFVTAAGLGPLLERSARQGQDIVCFEVDGRAQPFPALYATRLSGPWGQALAASPSVRELLQTFHTCRLPEEALRRVDPTLRLVSSVNTEADAQRSMLEGYLS
jgi:molybdenum cofactor guanylyltransferase